jgi:hypothetical protein
MTGKVWEEGPIAKQHDRAAFDCGDSDLTLTLKRYSRQNRESTGAKCFAAAPLATTARISSGVSASTGGGRRVPNSRVVALSTKPSLVNLGRSLMDLSLGTPRNDEPRPAINEAAYFLTHVRPIRDLPIIDKERNL